MFLNIINIKFVEKVGYSLSLVIKTVSQICYFQNRKSSLKTNKKYKTKLIKMRYGQIVMGPAGSGKSTYCSTLVKHAEVSKRRVHVINLDPAAETFEYEPTGFCEFLSSFEWIQVTTYIYLWDRQKIVLFITCYCSYFYLKIVQLMNW